MTSNAVQLPCSSEQCGTVHTTVIPEAPNLLVHVTVLCSICLVLMCRHGQLQITA